MGRARVIERISADLRDAFPEMKGFSASNLKYMRFFAQECPDIKIPITLVPYCPHFAHETITFYLFNTLKQSYGIYKQKC